MRARVIAAVVVAVAARSRPFTCSCTIVYIIFEKATTAGPAAMFGVGVGVGVGGEGKESGLASALARLQHGDDLSLSMGGYQHDDDDDVLSDVLLGSANGGNATTNSTEFGELFGGGGGGEGDGVDSDGEGCGGDLTLSPQTFTSSTEAFLNDNSNSLGAPPVPPPAPTAGQDADTVGSSSSGGGGTDDARGGSDGHRLGLGLGLGLAVKKVAVRPKAVSPNRQGPQQCQVCGKVFGNASALAKHKLTHSDERKYVCTMCGKAFKRQDHLNGHLLTHRNKKPYECRADGCGKSYCDARSLRRHTENHHSGSSPAPASPATCIQYAPPPPPPPPPGPVAAPQARTSSRLQRLLAAEPSSTTATDATAVDKPANNDGLTKQQLDLIQQIMQQTQQQAAKQLQAQAQVKAKAPLPAPTPTPALPSPPSRSPPATVSSTKPKHTWTTGQNCVSVSSTTPKGGPVTSPVVSSSPNTHTHTHKPVECNLCHRKFKNVPALNGHMRLHGGYFKKMPQDSKRDEDMIITEEMLSDEDSDSKKCGDKKDVSGPPLQTASVSVRALIEEKIIQKRITTSLTYSIAADPNLSAASTVAKACSLKRHSEGTEAVARVSPNRESETPSSTSSLKTSHMKQNTKVAVKRAISDPGSIQRHSDVTGGGESHQDMFQQVHVQDSLLLHGVDPAQLADSIQAVALQDITSLDDYQDSPQQEQQPDFQHHPDLQSALDSPLPAGLADFAYAHGQPDTYAAYPTPPASQEGGRSPLPPATTSAYFTTASAVVEATLSEVIPLSSIQHVYSCPLPLQAAAAAPASASASASVTASSPVQSHMMPNSEDPLLSSSPKEFAPRKRFDFHTFKLLSNGTIDLSSGSVGQDVTGIVLDRNGELKLIQTSCNFQPVKASALLNGTTTVYVNATAATVPKVEAVDHKAMKTVIASKGMLKTHSDWTNSARLLDHIKEEVNEDKVFSSPASSTPTLENGGTAGGKRARLSEQPFRSRLRRVLRGGGHRSSQQQHYTPPPMLPPSRPGHGLYWQAALAWPSSTTDKGELADESSEEPSDSAPESDQCPHVNVGPQYQVHVPPPPPSPPAPTTPTESDYLLWDPGITKLTSGSEVDLYLEFACCSALPGGGRNKEYALHLLHLCQGDIHEAMVRLMEPVPRLPAGHPLLSVDYADSDRWTLCEVDAFQQAIAKCDKDFAAIAREVDSKNVKQCVQFYYLWKKLCPEDHKRLRLGRRRNRDSESEFEFYQSDIPTSDVDLVSTSTESRLFVCEYHDCSASFNSRAALNGHIRIHGRRSPTPAPPSAHPHPHHSAADPLDEFPCKICGKVFNKVKSRSAHMKSHRPPDAEPKKPKLEMEPTTVPVTTIRPPVTPSSM